MQKGKSKDPLSTWLPIKEFVSKIDKLKWSWRLKTPCIYIVRKKDYHVDHNLELIIFRHCEIIKEKIALNSTQTHSHSTCIQISLIMNSFTKFMLAKQAHKKQEHKTWTRYQRTYIHNCGDIIKKIVDPIYR